MKIKNILFVFIVSIFGSSVLSASQQLDGLEHSLKNLCSLFGPSGFEDDVRNFLIEKRGDKVQEVKVDRLGNVYFGVNAKLDDTSKPTVVLMAHMDEVGLMVKSITDEGYITFQELGGWFEVALVTQKWIIKTDTGQELVGFTGFDAPHLTGHEKYPSPGKIPSEKMFIDIGARSKEEAETMGIRPGLPIAPYPSFEKLGPEGKRYLAKAHDDRAPFLVMDRVMQNLVGKDLGVNVVVVGTVQEEVGIRGARVVANTVKPDIVLNLEVSMANDFPLQVGDPGEGTKLGKGPALFVFDGSMIPDQQLLSYLIKLSKEKDISYQFESMRYYGQDGASIQRMLEGISTINLGIPCRYAHSHGSIIDRFDIDEMIKLLTAVLLDLNQDKVQAIIKK